jgi:hypothetical protein
VAKPTCQLSQILYVIKEPNKMISIECNSAPILAASLSRCFSNVSRVSSLIETYKNSQNEDILRLSIVYLHSTLEDCMRNLIFHYLDSNHSIENINSIPLIGHTNTKRAEKFFLGELIKFKDKSITSLISESIEEFVNRETFNNSNDIARWLDKCKVDKTKVINLLPQINDIISRRHNVVHNSDFSVNRSILSQENKVKHDVENDVVTSIDLKTIEAWISVVSQFFMEIIPSFIPKGGEITMKNI